MTRQGHPAPKLWTPATLITVGVAPLFLYPCLYVVLLATDTVFGDRIILDHLFTVSKRDIWDLFWGDWGAALIPSYLIALPTLAAALVSRHRTGKSLWVSLPALALAAGLVVSIAVFSGGHMFVIFTTAILFSLPSTWVLS